jgi:hypothetical protein
MVQQATGAVDSAGIAGQVNGEATAAGISMSLGAIIKRHKRTLINFQQSFLLPFVTKAAHRYMQFDPEHYPVADYKFNATSTLGIIAREYEITQLTQLLQTMSPESPLYPALIQSIIENMNLSNRDDLLAAMQQASQPNPQQQQMQQQAAQAQMALQQAQTQALAGQAAESQARAQKYMVDAQLAPQELEIDKIEAITRNLREGDADDKEFERRLKIADLALKEKSNNDKVRMIGETTRANDTNRNEQPPQADQRSISNALGSLGGSGGQSQGPRGAV